MSDRPIRRSKGNRSLCRVWEVLCGPHVELFPLTFFGDLNQNQKSSTYINAAPTPQRLLLLKVVLGVEYT